MLENSEFLISNVGMSDVFGIFQNILSKSNLFERLMHDLLQGSTSCVECPAGYSCPKASTRISCSEGSYSLLGDAICTVCPAGYACPTTTEIPFKCQLGQTTNGKKGSTNCTNCPAGFQCRQPE